MSPLPDEEPNRASVVPADLARGVCSGSSPAQHEHWHGGPYHRRGTRDRILSQRGRCRTALRSIRLLPWLNRAACECKGGAALYDPRHRRRPFCDRPLPRRRAWPQGRPRSRRRSDGRRRRQTGPGVPRHLVQPDDQRPPFRFVRRPGDGHGHSLGDLWPRP
jgi:hypothetical protein